MDSCVNHLLEQLAKLDIKSEQILKTKPKSYEPDNIKVDLTDFDIGKTLTEVTELEQNIAQNMCLATIRDVIIKYQQVSFILR